MYRPRAELRESRVSWKNLLCACAIVVVSLSLSSGCGFHPRGSVTQLTDLGSIYIDADPDLSFSDLLRQAIVDAAFRLAPNRDEADILLRLTRESKNERVISVKSNGRVSELALSHAISMLTAQSVNGDPPVYDPVQIPNRVEVNREYTYDETGVLGKENEARILQEEMEQELVRQIVLRTIASLAPSVTSQSIDSTEWTLSLFQLLDTGSDL